MYNKLFTKILDSSIWMEPTPTRIVWLTLIAAMDEVGFVPFASVANLAHRAIVPLKDAEEAVKCLESPDANSSDPEFEGRRIERVDGGWIIINAEKYRALGTRAIIQEQTKARVRKYRERKKCNASVTHDNENVTPSEAIAIAKSIAEANTTTLSTKVDRRDERVTEIFEFWKVELHHPKAVLDQKRGRAIKARLKEGYSVERIKEAIVGIQRCAHNMGVNDRQEVYDDIELICRTGANVDRFADTRHGENPHVFKAKQKMRSYLIGDYSDQK